MRKLVAVSFADNNQKLVHTCEIFIPNALTAIGLKLSRGLFERLERLSYINGFQWVTSCQDEHVYYRKTVIILRLSPLSAVAYYDYYFFKMFLTETE